MIHARVTDSAALAGISLDLAASYLLAHGWAEESDPRPGCRTFAKQFPAPTRYSADDGKVYVLAVVDQGYGDFDRRREELLYEVAQADGVSELDLLVAWGGEIGEVVKL